MFSDIVKRRNIKVSLVREGLNRLWCDFPWLEQRRYFAWSPAEGLFILLGQILDAVFVEINNRVRAQIAFCTRCKIANAVKSGAATHV